MKKKGTAGGFGFGTKNSHISEREEDELRGPVKACFEETTYSGSVAADAVPFPDQISWQLAEYDIEGRVAARFSRALGSPGSETRHIFDMSGRLLKTTDRQGFEPATECVYSYDNEGRIRNTLNSRSPDNPVTFHYDDDGKRTKMQVSRPGDFRSDLIDRGASFQSFDEAPNFPGGGSAATIYDEHDRPTEIQIRNAQGELLGRVFRTYTGEGYIAEEKQILEDPVTFYPPGRLAKILEIPGVSRQELREQVTKLMGGWTGPWSVAYCYDAQGRITQTLRRLFTRETTIEVTYNEQGDKASEIMRITRVTDGNEEARRSLFFESESRFSYSYDGAGNWTQKEVFSRSSPGGTFERSSKSRRSLHYF